MANEKIIYVKNSNIWIWVTLGIAILGVGGYFGYKYLKKQKSKKLAENAVKDKDGFYKKEEIDAAKNIDGLKENDNVKVKRGTMSKVWNIADKTKPFSDKNLKSISKDIEVPDTKYTILTIGTEGLPNKGLRGWAFIKDSLDQIFQVYTNTLIKI